MLVKMSASFDELTIDQFRTEFGEPETEPITRLDGKPLDSCVPPYAVLPLYLGKKAQDFTLADAHGLILSDFGEAFSPTTEQRLGRDCNIPLAKRAPEALFEPDSLVSYPSDIWSLGTAIWNSVLRRTNHVPLLKMPSMCVETSACSTVMSLVPLI